MWKTLDFEKLLHNNSIRYLNVYPDYIVEMIILCIFGLNVLKLISLVSFHLMCLLENLNLQNGLTFVAYILFPLHGADVKI